MKEFEFLTKYKTSAEVRSALILPRLDSFRRRIEANNGEEWRMKGDYACSMLNMSEDFTAAFPSRLGRIIWVSEKNERILHSYTLSGFVGLVSKVSCLPPIYFIPTH